MSWTLFLPVFIHLPLNGELKHHHVVWPRIIWISYLPILPSAPPPPLSHVPTRDHCATWERTEEGGSDCRSARTQVCERIAQPSRHTAHCPPYRACSSELTGSPFITLENINLPQTPYLSELHLLRSCWSSFHTFSLPIISLSITICIKGKLTPV